MSTKCSVKYEHDTETGLGFHLYTDWLDRCAGSDVVSLQLDGVEFEATAYNGGTSVTVTIPRGMAERLGLVQPAAVDPMKES